MSPAAHPTPEPPGKGADAPHARRGPLRLRQATVPTHTLRFRVRYSEVDAMGYLHHSRFLQYFETGRIELLRARGVSYADLERRGIFFVVIRAEVQYCQPARYDDEVELTTAQVRRGHVKIEHEYELQREDVLLATGKTTIACVGRDGKPMQIPDTF